MKKTKQKICFVISPIGQAKSETRKRSDNLLKFIIKPITDEFDYKTLRADELDEPGIITKQVIEHILNDDLVIADLTSLNPNVFYELAVRHTIRKPVVQMIDNKERIPFDVYPLRTIGFDIRDIESVDNCKKELREQIKNLEENPDKIDNPITVAVDLQELSRSGRPQDEINAEIISLLQDIKYRLSRIHEGETPIQYGTAWSGTPLVTPAGPAWVTPSSPAWVSPTTGTAWITPAGPGWVTSAGEMPWLSKNSGVTLGTQEEVPSQTIHSEEDQKKSSRKTRKTTHSIKRKGSKTEGKKKKGEDKV